MLDRPTQAYADKVIDLVSYVLAKHAVVGPVAPEVDLTQFGLTSIDMVELMLAVEADFDVTIPASEITLENFSSVRSIEMLVRRLRPDLGGVAPVE